MAGLAEFDAAIMELSPATTSSMLQKDGVDVAW
jgi:hypothetical protein